MNNEPLYIKRMADSVVTTSKAKIPEIISGLNKDNLNVLDVGCNNGTLMDAIGQKCPTATIKGVDKRAKTDQATLAYSCTGKTIFPCSFEEFVRMKSVDMEPGLVSGYDVVVFASVLHEISSYCTVKNTRYKTNPIMEALLLTRKILNPGGIIIIRDGLSNELFSDKSDLGITVNRKGLRAFKKYVRENPCFICEPKDFVYEKKAGGFVTVTGKPWKSYSSQVIKEWLFTYTWGKGSYRREVQEKYGILSDSDWKCVIRETGFELIEANTYAEEYADYLYKTGVFADKGELEKIMEQSVGLYVARMV